jgi:hypothetical protein
LRSVTISNKGEIVPAVIKTIRQPATVRSDELIGTPERLAERLRAMRAEIIQRLCGRTRLDGGDLNTLALIQTDIDAVDDFLLDPDTP